MQPVEPFAGAASRGFALFSTPIGAAGIAWGDGGLVALQLPESSPAGTRARLAARVPEAGEAAPPPPVEAAIGAVTAVLAGTPVDLQGIRLDWTGVSPFCRAVYEAARQIRFGETATYGELAEWLGKPGAARAVGAALGRNPFAVVVPCHRVVAAAGPGGFSAAGGVATKRRMLAAEAGAGGAAPRRPRGRRRADRAGAIELAAPLRLAVE